MVDRSVYNGEFRSGSYTEVSVKTPNYRQLRRERKELPLNMYLFERQDRVSSRSYYAGARFVDRVISGFTRCPGTYVDTPIPSVSNEEAILRNQLDKKLRRTQIDMGTALGEYRETAKFVTQTVVRVAKGIKALRKGNLTAAFRALHGGAATKGSDFPKSVSSFWLSYQYGFIPLVNDVFAAIELLQHTWETPMAPVRTRSRRYTEVNAMSSTGPEFWGPGIEKMELVNGSITCTGAIVYRVNNPLYRTLDQCGLMNPYSVAWELLPFSFVADWFIPVGRFLQGVQPPQGLEFLRGYRSTHIKGTCAQFESDEGIKYVRSPYQSTTINKSMKKYRAILTDFPRYSIVVPDISLSKEQVASAIALVTQAALGWKR